jgi:flavin reductase (DIM6/NTAB) family NADH-FMN oxidoreductase RutF
MELRKAFGTLATGVTTVSCLDSETGLPHGMTANSFTCVSMDPPLVLVALSNEAQTFRLIDESEFFGVSVLAEPQKHQSDVFAVDQKMASTTCFTCPGAYH